MIMLIDFSAIEEAVIPNMRGGEKEFRVRMHTDDMARIMQGRLVPGASIGLHTHAEDCEVIFFLEGSGKMICDGVTEPVQAGSCHYCPKGHNHTMINDGDQDLRFFAVVPKQ